MFREMRRKKQQLSPEDCASILNRGTSGVLALLGESDYPYALPLSYVYDNGKIFFHSAKSGHKIDAIIKNDKASFCVIDKDQVVPEEYTSYFRSVIVFGKIRILESDTERRNAIEKLAIKYAQDDSVENRDKLIDREWNLTCMLEMNIEHMTGKEAIEIVRAKQESHGNR